jgi:hypothetical protein
MASTEVMLPGVRVAVAINFIGKRRRKEICLRKELVRKRNQHGAYIMPTIMK